MIYRISGRIRLQKSIKRKIDKRWPFKGGDWDLDTEDVKCFKKSVKVQLLELQKEKCAYCGLTLDETGRSEIEHFAPKGGPIIPKHVEFMFTVFNLVLSCNLCNSPIKKGRFDTLITKDSDYSKCTFRIVHPYFDDTKEHYDWAGNDGKLLIQGKSTKGLKSISLFKLDSSRHSEARAKQLTYETLMMTKDGRDLIDKILNYRNS